MKETKSIRKLLDCDLCKKNFLYTFYFFYI